IRDKVSEANEAVIRIRELKKQIGERSKALSDAAIQSSLKALEAKLGAIEEDLYQVRNQSSQDPLNFPIKLNNRLAALQRSVETGDNKPTDGAFKVFAELSNELAGHIKKLQSLFQTDLVSLNKLLDEKGVELLK
ncbi:MAG: glycosyl hydrolase, partial [Haliscomenobacter sp.]|nr:glycosyl hydrolase [Haliscomenobacter sp.]